MLASSTISTTSSWIVAGLAVAVAVVLVTLLVLNRRDRRRLAATTEQLAASEARLRQLAETVPAGIFQTDAEGKRLYVNPRLVDITGDPSTNDVLDRPWLIHEDDDARVRDEWANAHGLQTSYRSRFRIRHSSGEIRWVAVEAQPIIADGAVTGWVGSVVDVTEETQAIAELRRFSEILEATPDLVAMVDTHGGFTYANAAARARFGIDDDDHMRRMRAIDVYAPSARALFFGEALATANRVGVWAGAGGADRPPCRCLGRRGRAAAAGRLRGAGVAGRRRAPSPGRLHRLLLLDHARHLRAPGARGAARAGGSLRPVDRAAQPRGVPAGARRRDGCRTARGRAGLRTAARPRSLQAGQRLVRPRLRRPHAAAGHAAASGRAGAGRCARALRQ